METQKPIEHVETYSIEGVAFEIRVSRVDWQFRVEWSCATCARRGSGPVPGASVGEAVRLARGICEGHHRLRHRAHALRSSRA